MVPSSQAAAHTLAAARVQAADRTQAALEQLEMLGIDPLSDAFARAVARKQRPVVDLLLRAGVSPNLPDAQERTPLFHAAAIGDEKLVSRLLAAGADPNLADRERVTPLMLASALGKVSLIDTLLQAGANADAADLPGRTPLHYALAAKQVPAVERILAENPQLDGRRCDDRDVVSVAADTGDWKLISLILERITERTWDYCGRSLLQKAVDARDVERIRFILSKHTGPATPDGCQDPLLAYAVAARDLDLARLLLDAGADPNTTFDGPAEPRFLSYTPAKFLQHYLTDEPGVTVLMVAAGLGFEDMVKLLIEKGADRFRATRSKHKLVPLYFAAWGDHPECIQALIGNSPTPDQWRIEISLGMQSATLYRDGSPVFRTEISSGRRGYSTPTGKFVVTDKKTHHISSIYKVKMPYFMRLSCRDFGMHEGHVPSYPASHGCIRLPGSAARRLFKDVPIGTLVTIRN